VRASRIDRGYSANPDVRHQTKCAAPLSSGRA